MLVLISPAKNLDFSPLSKELPLSQPPFLSETEKLVKKLKKLKPSDFETLMHISPKLADLNYERYQNFKIPFPTNETKAALYAFNGEVYNGLDAHSFSDEDIHYASTNLRILSGLYGLLNPLDQILPYRLEMGTKFKFNEKINNLYEFWNDKITKNINQLIKEDGHSHIINLASAEYFKSIKLNKIKKPIITPIFKEHQNNTYKVVMMYAKNARGKMSRFIIQNKINNIEELKAFDMDGYQFNEALSNPNEWIFTR